MKTFKVEIEELLQKVIEVEAKDEREALDKVLELYRSGEVELDYEDLKYYDVKVLEENE